MPGVLTSGKLPLDFQSLSVQVRGEATAAVADLLQSDRQRQTTGWTVTHGLSVSVLSDRPSMPVQGVPAGRQVTAPTHGGPLAFSAEGEVFGWQGLTLETSALHSHIALNEQVSNAALLLAFTEVQRAAGLLPLHASVLSRGGQTVAVTGSSGAGKSTAALRLLGREWQLVAEDWAWLDPLTMQLTGWDSGLRVHSDSLALFGPAAASDSPHRRPRQEGTQPTASARCAHPEYTVFPVPTRRKRLPTSSASPDNAGDARSQNIRATRVGDGGRP